MITTAITFESEKKRQRALVLQGGGALGAYEAGAFKALYEFISKKDDGKPFFDIIAGTSIGAINAAILVGHVIENNNNWEGSDERLIGFWKDIASWDILGSPVFREFNKWWASWWSSLQSIPFAKIAPPEAARRYYTAKIAGYFGVPTVFTPVFNPLFVLDTRYLDNFTIPNNMWFRYDPNLLEQSMLKKHCKFPIKVNGNKEEYPRLLTISTDIKEGVPVIFDSYLLKSDVKIDNGKGKYTIEYPDGIISDHIIASASVPINYNYKVIKDTNAEEHYLWDGGLLSNTPLSELLQLHSYYYYERIADEKGGWDKLEGKDWNEISVPDLKEIYLINVNPTTQPHKPTDRDNALSRCLDITFSDKTKIVQSELQFIGEQTDIIASYRDFAMRLVNGFGENADAERSKKIVKIFENFISEEAYRRVSDADVDNLKQIHWTVLGRILFGLERDGKIDAQLIKKIKDALKVHDQKPVQEIIPEKRVSASALGALFAKQHHPKKIPLFDMDKASFRVNNIQRIEHIYNENDIAGKMFDFSRSTITQLLKEGYDDASKQLRTSMTVAQTEKPGM